MCRGIVIIVITNDKAKKSSEFFSEWILLFHSIRNAVLNRPMIGKKTLMLSGKPIVWLNQNNPGKLAGELTFIDE